MYKIPLRDQQGRVRELVEQINSLVDRYSVLFHELDRECGHEFVREAGWGGDADCVDCGIRAKFGKGQLFEHSRVIKVEDQRPV